MTTRGISRRAFIGNAALASAAVTILQGRDLLIGRGWLEAAPLPTTDLLEDTLNGLLAFVVPGRDDYSTAQGLSTVEPGGVEAGVMDVLLATLDDTTPFIPQFSATVASVLNGIAESVHPAAAGSFVSPFARLSFPEKALVFQIMDSTDSLKVLGGALPLFAAFFVYSEAGAFDPATRSLTGHPLGWQISNYEGVADGRDEFRGYYHDRRSES